MTHAIPAAPDDGPSGVAPPSRRLAPRRTPKLLRMAAFAAAAACADGDGLAITLAPPDEAECVTVLDDDLAPFQTLLAIEADGIGDGAWYVVRQQDGQNVLRRRPGVDEDPVEPLDLGGQATRRFQLVSDTSGARAWLLERETQGAAFVRVHELAPGYGVVASSNNLAQQASLTSAEQGLLVIDQRPFVLNVPNTLSSQGLFLQLFEFEEDLSSPARWDLLFPGEGPSPGELPPQLRLGPTTRASLVPTATALELQREDGYGGWFADVLVLRLRWESGAPIGTYIALGTEVRYASVPLGLDPFAIAGAPGVTNLVTGRVSAGFAPALTTIEWTGGAIGYTSEGLIDATTRATLLQLPERALVSAVADGQWWLAVADEDGSSGPWQSIDLNEVVDVLPAGLSHAIAVRSDGRKTLLALRCAGS